MGIMNPNAIVPLIIKRIPNTGADWFFALEKIAGDNVAKDAIDFEGALASWRSWADNNTLARELDAVPAA